MRITIVMGFFLPMPPAAGGATEKSWDGLAREFVVRGHEVTVISRTWENWPKREIVGGVWHLRIPGYAHTARLPRNLWLDFKWSLRAWFSLPAADVTIVNCIALPIWLGRLNRRAGRVVLMPGRVPKGQFRMYGGIDRILAVSSPVRKALLAENPAFAPVTKTFGCPIDWSLLAQPRLRSADAPVVIGFIGRIHTEKGLDLLISALEVLARRTDLPSWRVLLCGPVDIARGGSGAAYAASLETRLGKAITPDRFTLMPPVFNSAELAAVYQKIDVFCYPSLAAKGETFGVAVAEAMAAGAVPVVSALDCFADFVRDGANGWVFNHTHAEAPAKLAEILAELVANSKLREQLARAAQRDVRTYDFPEFAGRLLEDFSTLNCPAGSRLIDDQ